MSAPTVDPTIDTWFICPSCRALVYRRRFERMDRVCSECGDYLRLDARRRLELLVDPGSAQTVEVPQVVEDPLGFVDRVPYRERLAQARRSLGQNDVVQVSRATVQGHPAVLAVMEFGFLGGSLGAAAGEAVVTAAEKALADRVPLVLVTASGGARMQEGVVSLLQMAKTAGAMERLDAAGLPTVSVITDPTFGGVAASFATLADVIIMESGARMGFAGPRVIEQTIRQTLPQDFQTAAFLSEHGLVDVVCDRASLRSVLGRVLRAARKDTEGQRERDATAPAPAPASIVRDPEQVQSKAAMTAVAMARDPARPTGLDHIATWGDGFIELHGDRQGGECSAVVGGIGDLDGRPIMVIAHQKGHSTPELVRRNFAMPQPAGYRKARRLMLMAAKWGLPVVTLVDTPGACPGVSAEEQGQASAIAHCISTMIGLPVPIVSVVTGEGGSGGALALGVADSVLMCENAIFSVISPEGCASILWKDPEKVPVAAEALGLDPRTLLNLALVDGVVPEPEGGSQKEPLLACEAVRAAVIGELQRLRPAPVPELLRRRRQRYREVGLPNSEWRQR